MSAEEQVAESTKTNARKSRDSMMSGITDEKLKVKVKLLADAAIAGVNVTNVKFGISATSEDEACDAAFIKMKLDSSKGACDAGTASGRRRRHLMMTNYVISIFINPAEVNEIALSEVLQTLATAGVSVDVTKADPIVALKTVPGMDANRVASFEADATAAVAAAVLARAANVSSPPPPKPSPPPLPPPRPSPPPMLPSMYRNSAAGRPSTFVCFLGALTTLFAYMS
jgi:hypothetical protein